MAAAELRALSTEVRASDDGSKRIAGYAATFGAETQISGPFSAGGGFKERVDAGAFNRCLASPDLDCRALFNHDPSAILGRSKSGTLKVSTDNTGLHYTIKLPANSLGDSVFESVRRKDISGSSFGFACRKDSWDHDTNTRTLLDLDLFDCGPVTFPAYQQTSVSVRSVSGTLETVKLAWYKAGKLRLPLVGEREMRQRVKQLRQELDGGADEECDCDCQSCAEDGDCSGCDCEMGCDGTGCGAGQCNCLERQARGKMRPAPGRTIHPIDRWALQQQRELEQKIFDARRLMKLARR